MINNHIAITTFLSYELRSSFTWYFEVAVYLKSYICAWYLSREEEHNTYKFLSISQWNTGDYSYIQGVNSLFDSLHIRRKLQQFWGTYFLFFKNTQTTLQSHLQVITNDCSVVAAIKQSSVNIYIRCSQKVLMW